MALVNTTNRYVITSKGNLPEHLRFVADELDALIQTLTQRGYSIKQRGIVSAEVMNTLKGEPTGDTYRSDISIEIVKDLEDGES